MQAALKNLICLSFIGGAALYLCPEGGVRRVLRILCAAIFAAAILKPLAGFDYELLSLEEARFASAEAEITRRAGTKEDTLKQLLLRENCERYIIDRGTELGLKIKEAAVELAQNPEGNRLPYKASIRAEGDETQAEALGRLIRDELGISTERQEWSLNE